MASLGLVGRLPSPVQRLVIDGADRLRRFLEQRAAAPTDLERMALLPASTGRRYAGERVVVAGLFGVRCGLQRGAQLMMLDLRARGIEAKALDLAPLLGMVPSLATDAIADPAQIAAWRPTDLVIHVNPPLFARALTALPPELLGGTCVIGNWVWELPVLSDEWRQCAGAADELWAPSPFVAEALTAGLPDFTGPIRLVPYAVDRDPMTPAAPQRRADLRARFGLAADAFVAGSSFSFDSNYARKNPCAAIDAFRLAFPAGEKVHLIIRCNDVARHARLFEHLASYAADDPRMLIWDNDPVGCGITDFYGLLDLYVSLHRSEGYGLNLAEALQSGLAVLATGWGLAPDLAAHPSMRTVGSRLVVPLDTQGVYGAYPGALWAEPDLPDAAAGLRAARAAWQRTSTVSALPAARAAPNETD